MAVVIRNVSDIFSGGVPTEQLPAARRKVREAALAVVSRIEASATQETAKQQADAATGRSNKRLRNTRKTDSKNKPTAVVRSNLFPKRRTEKTAYLERATRPAQARDTINPINGL